MRRIREVIVVEGKYDKNTLSQIVDTLIVTLEGFSVFRDREKLFLLRRLAEERGVILLTDSDGAGFTLRGYLKGALPRDRVKHAYIPDIPGKERRKRAPGKEGRLGVEGMSPAVLLEALRRAGATFLDEPEAEQPESGHLQASVPVTGVKQPEQGERTASVPVTKADLCAWGLSGGEGSAEKRRALLRRLSFPEKMSANAMLQALNLLYTREELEALIREETRQ